MDVVIEGAAEGHPTKGVIECKDFNPKTTGPVGINYVDALESKRHDVGAQFSMICSNAGFTADAIRKAKRVNIGLVSVMRKGDHRVRFAVVEEIYSRKLGLLSVDLALSGSTPISLNGVPFQDVLYETVPVANWVYARIMRIITSNPVVKGKFNATHRLTRPLVFAWPGGSAEATSLEFSFTIEGAWFSHQVEIDSTAGIYDWMRRRVRVAPGIGKLEIKGIDIHGGERITLPPDRELIREHFNPGEVAAKFIFFRNLPTPVPIPELDKFIAAEDLNPILPSLPPEVVTSA